MQDCNHGSIADILEEHEKRFETVVGEMNASSAACLASIKELESVLERKVSDIVKVAESAETSAREASNIFKDYTKALEPRQKQLESKCSNTEQQVATLKARIEQKMDILVQDTTAKIGDTECSMQDIRTETTLTFKTLKRKLSDTEQHVTSVDDQMASITARMNHMETMLQSLSIDLEKEKQSHKKQRVGSYIVSAAVGAFTAITAAAGLLASSDILLDED